MHQVSFDLTLEEISKIEGHAALDIKVVDGKVTETKFQITEYKRFYTQALRGKSISAIPQLLSRICGTCSNAHLMCSIEAMEKGLDIKVSEQTRLLKRLTMHGLMIRDHSLHLYLFIMPDVFGMDSLLDFDENNADEMVNFSNAASCIRRCVWDDHNFVIMPAAEDREWAKWALENRYNIVYCADASVYHSHNESCLNEVRRIIEIEKMMDIQNSRRRTVFLTIKQSLGMLVRSVKIVCSADEFASVRVPQFFRCFMKSFLYMVEFVRCS